MAATVRPDVVLMDLNMPGVGGVPATERLTAAHPDLAVLVLTLLDASVLPAIRAGARGYLLLKDAGVHDLLRAITAVHRGKTILSK